MFGVRPPKPKFDLFWPEMSQTQAQMWNKPNFEPTTKIELSQIIEVLTHELGLTTKTRELAKTLK